MTTLKTTPRHSYDPNKGNRLSKSSQKTAEQPDDMKVKVQFMFTTSNRCCATSQTNTKRCITLHIFNGTWVLPLGEHLLDLVCANSSIKSLDLVVRSDFISSSDSTESPRYNSLSRCPSYSPFVEGPCCHDNSLQATATCWQWVNETAAMRQQQWDRSLVGEIFLKMMSSLYLQSNFLPSLSVWSYCRSWSSGLLAVRLSYLSPLLAPLLMTS